MNDLAPIYPIILCGGTGTRLWPLSRKARPKQFAKLLGEESLLAESLARLRGDEFASPILLTHADYRFQVRENLEAQGFGDARILLEPEAKNTAASVLAGLISALADAPDAVVLIMPSDHQIADVAAFGEAVRLGRAALDEFDIVTFGIEPTHAETGYGYLLPQDSGAVGALKGFTEKPDAKRAERLVSDGNLWNSGIFLARASRLLQIYREHADAMVGAVEAALQNAQSDLGFMRLAADDWAAIDNISFDYAIMEKAGRLGVVRVDMGWSDLGDWRSIWQAGARDENEVAVLGNARAQNCENALIFGADDAQIVVGVGLRNQFLIGMKDAVISGSLDDAQDVRMAVAKLQEEGLAQAEELNVMHRPWGSYEVLAEGPMFKVKRIVVKPNSALSLQRHEQRSEHWTVVEGLALVEVDGVVSELGVTQSIDIPLGAMHRLTNSGKEMLTVIEVQSGAYLGEDDIERFEDDYARIAAIRPL